VFKHIPPPQIIAFFWIDCVAQACALCHPKRLDQKCPI
jgi:hypothetical protein